MAVVDLYTPRIEEEGRNKRFKQENLTNTLGEAAKQLFNYSINKQLIDKAYAEIEAKAQTERMKSQWEDKMNANELANRRWNSSKVALAQNPNDQQAWQVYSDNMFEATGVRPDEQRKKDIIDHLSGLTIDPKTGGYTAEAQRIMADANKMESPTGQLLSDYYKLRERGVSNDDPAVQSIFGQLAKQAATDINAQAGEYLRHIYETQGPEAAAGVYEYWKTLGPPSSTNVNVKLPGEGERKSVVDAIVAKKKIEMIRSLYNQVKAKYGNWINTPTGTGAELAQGIISKLPASIVKSDKLITEFQKAVNDYGAVWTHAITGAQHSDRETERYIGSTFSGGSLIANHLGKDEFEATLDFNQRQATDYLDQMLSTQEGYGLRTPPPGAGRGEPPPAGAPEGAAAKENKGPGAERGTKLQELEAQRKELIKRKAAAGKSEKRKGGAVPPPAPPMSAPQPEPQSSNAQLFNRALALNMLGTSYGQSDMG